MALAFGPLAVEGAVMDQEGTSFKAHPHKSELIFPKKFGMSGKAAGNGFPEYTYEQILDTYEAAWQMGVRYFDAAPFYGTVQGERRFRRFLYTKPRNQYILSTPLNVTYCYDYSASDIRRTIEGSLRRLDVSQIDIVNIQDLSPGILGKNWWHHFNMAAEHAMPELSRMREEGIIKGWGLTATLPNTIVRTLDIADPDFMFIATKYSLLDHAAMLHRAFPAMQQKNVKAIIGAPFNNGLLAGREQVNDGTNIPNTMADKLQQIAAVAEKYHVDVRTAALQFAAAHPATAMILPGTSNAEHVIENIFSMYVRIPSAFWQELKAMRLIAQDAPVPTVV